MQLGYTRSDPKKTKPRNDQSRFHYICLVCMYSHDLNNGQFSFRYDCVVWWRFNKFLPHLSPFSSYGSTWTFIVGWGQNIVTCCWRHRCRCVGVVWRKVRDNCRNKFHFVKIGMTFWQNVFVTVWQPWLRWISIFGMLGWKAPMLLVNISWDRNWLPDWCFTTLDKKTFVLC